jgi:hypothetical protein
MASPISHHEKMTEGGFTVVSRSKPQHSGAKRGGRGPSRGAPRGAPRASGGFRYNKRKTVETEMDSPERRFRSLVEKVEKVMCVSFLCL